jgi:hypothetical protein
LQTPEGFEKHQYSSFSKRPLSLNRLDKEIFYQGFEDKILSSLDKDPRVCNVSTSAKHMPKINWCTVSGKKKRYFPDIVAKLNTGKYLVIEVKSPYTLLKDEAANRLKFKAALSQLPANYHFLVCVLRDRQKLEWFKNPSKAFTAFRRQNAN